MSEQTPEELIVLELSKAKMEDFFSFSPDLDDKGNLAIEIKEAGEALFKKAKEIRPDFDETAFLKGLISIAILDVMAERESE